ncbi:hypothetical protein L3V83_14335 [Thiotrichales bacterium 19X7-9]|nr:hypothetical protein [Thiotrichales bacterium 19X7-9]
MPKTYSYEDKIQQTTNNMNDYIKNYITKNYQDKNFAKYFLRHLKKEINKLMININATTITMQLYYHNSSQLPITFNNTNLDNIKIPPPSTSNYPNLIFKITNCKAKDKFSSNNSQLRLNKTLDINKCDPINLGDDMLRLSSSDIAELQKSDSLLPNLTTQQQPKSNDEPNINHTINYQFQYNKNLQVNTIKEFNSPQEKIRQPKHSNNQGRKQDKVSISKFINQIYSQTKTIDADKLYNDLGIIQKIYSQESNVYKNLTEIRNELSNAKGKEISITILYDIIKYLTYNYELLKGKQNIFNHFEQEIYNSYGQFRSTVVHTFATYTVPKAYLNTMTTLMDYETTAKPKETVVKFFQNIITQIKQCNNYKLNETYHKKFPPTLSEKKCLQTKTLQPTTNNINSSQMIELLEIILENKQNSKSKKFIDLHNVLSSIKANRLDINDNLIKTTFRLICKRRHKLGGHELSNSGAKLLDIISQNNKLSEIGKTLNITDEKSLKAYIDYKNLHLHNKNINEQLLIYNTDATDNNSKITLEKL